MAKKPSEMSLDELYAESKRLRAESRKARDKMEEISKRIERIAVEQIKLGMRSRSPEKKK